MEMNHVTGSLSYGPQCICTMLSFALPCSRSTCVDVIRHNPDVLTEREKSGHVVEKDARLRNTILY